MTRRRGLCEQFPTLTCFTTVCFTIVFAAFAAPAAEPRPPWRTSRLKGTPEPPAKYEIRPAFPVRFQLPTSIVEIPGERRMLVTEKDGRVLTFAMATKSKRVETAIDLAKTLPRDLLGESVSVWSATLHPDFADNRYVYVCYVHPGDGGHTRVSRFKLSAAMPPRLSAGDERVIIKWPAGGHNAGCLQFGKDGFLYISTGDGFGPNPPDNLNTGQDVSDLLGSILRIDVDASTAGRAYGVPKDNPFVDMAGARPEIWAYGLRNPWKFGVDSVTGNIFAADNGWESWEMVHQIVRGGNCGWPIMEGRAPLRSEIKRGPTPIIPPVKDHPHTEANSVIGGPVYRGSKLAALQGSFVYGDYITGTIWALRPGEEDNYEHTTLVDTDQRIVAFGEGSKGELYVLDYDFTGQVYELLPSNQPDLSAQFPRRLSETGLFASTAKLEPSPGVVPYSVTAARWQDGATAQRWVAIPGDGVIRTPDRYDQAAGYPAGTVFVKQLNMPRAGRDALRVETQILHYENGQWNPYSYLWDEDGRDASLVESIGANRTLQLPAKKGQREQTWRAGALNECRLCHNAGSHSVLGFTLNQLNRATTAGSQLTSLSEQGVIDRVPASAPDPAARLVNPHDAKASLDDRARSYLHVNCSACHHPGGNAIVSFYLRREMPLAKLDTNKGTGIGTFGMRNAKLLVPGDPYRSVIFYRMSKLGYARMPYIGSQVVDSRGVALIESWIRSLSDDLVDNSSGPLRNDSPEARSLAALRSGDQDQIGAAVSSLLQSTEGSLAAMAQLHQRSVRPRAARALISAAKKSPSDVSGLFENFLPESQRRARLGPNIDPATILELAGDSARGKLIFYSDAARCRACHDMDSAEKSLGPTLVQIAKKYPRRGEMLQHVLQPSIKMEDVFATHSFVTTKGEIVVGMIIEKTPRKVVLKTAERKIVTLQNDDIDEMKKSPKSLMPDRILSDLTAQEAADLLAFIGTVAPPTTQPPRK